MNLFALSGLLAAINSFAFGIFSWVKGKRFLNKIWALFNLAVAIWGFGAYKFSSTLDKQDVFLWLRIGHIGVIFIPVLFLHFLLELLEIKKKKLIYIIYGTGIFFSILNITDWLGITKIFIVSLRYVFDSFYVDSPAGPLYPIFVSFFFAAVVYAHYLGIKHLRSATGLKLMQIKYFLFATALGFSGGGTAFFMVFNVDIYPYLHFTVCLYPVVMTYAIFRYRLMNINVALTRAGIFAFVYSLVLGIPLFIGYRYGLWQYSTWLMLFLATSGPFIYLFLKRKAEDRILEGQRKQHDFLLRASRSITLIKKLRMVLRYIGILTTNILKVNYSAIFLLDKKNSTYHLASSRGSMPILKYTIIEEKSPLIEYLLQNKKPVIYEEIKQRSQRPNSIDIKEVDTLMQSVSAKLIVPSFLKDNLLGFIILGNKVSGDIYTEDDLAALSIMANYSALAIEYAQFVNELEELHAKLRETEKLKGIAQMMRSLNHELNNIFNKMVMPLDMVRMGDFAPNTNEYDNALKTVSENIELGTEILKYVQSYRHKSKEDTLKSKKIDEVIANALSVFSKRFQDANITAVRKIEPNLPTIQAKASFDEFPVNILANCYFSLIDKEQGDRLIDIQAGIFGDKKATQVTFSDTGIDITKCGYGDDKDSPFRERGKLGGVNLFLAHLILNDHNATLETKSYEKGGTTFVVKIPVV